MTTGRMGLGKPLRWLRSWSSLLVWGWLLAWSGMAHAGSLALPASGSVSHMGMHWEALEDAGGALTFTEVRQRPKGWSPTHQADPNFGYSRSAFWLRATLHNPHTDQRDWLLGVRYPLIDYLDVYFVSANGAVHQRQTGDRRPYASREIDDRNFFFSFQVPPGEQVTVYVRVQSQGSIQAPMVLSTPAAFRSSMAREHVLQGVYAGALLAMLVYNLLLFTSLRERAYLYYVAYLVLFGLTQMAFNGMAYQFLWPDSPNWGNQAAPILMGLTGAMLTQFSREFLALKQHWPKMDRVVRVSLWGFLAVAAGGLTMAYTVPIRLGTLITILAPVLHLTIATLILRRGQQQAFYFLAAFGGLLVGVLLAALQAYDLVPTSFLTEYGLQIGSLLEVTLLSYALAHRLKLAQEANERLQKAHANELEERVRSRTMDLDRALQDLTDANTRLHALTVRDALTGLHNRLYLNERLPELWRQAQRWHQSLSVLMIDVDHFKQVNDRFGHAAGDQALRLVAQTLAQLLGRPGDLAVRYGGEEFLALLPQTNLTGAAHIAETVRQCVEALDCQVNGEHIPLTVSIGVASTLPGPHGRVEDLLHAADHLLYAAKHAGRNRCEVQGPA